MTRSRQPELTVVTKVIPLTKENDPDGSRRQAQLYAIVKLLRRAAVRPEAQARMRANEESARSRNQAPDATV